MKVCVFSEKENQAQLKMGVLGDLAYQHASVAVFSHFCIQNNLKADSEMVQTHKLF